MRVTNASRGDLTAALAAINKGYGNNIEFRSIEPMNKKGTAFNFRLKAKDPHDIGGQMSPSGRATGSASWEAHGSFFDALTKLQPAAKVKTRVSTITAQGGNWKDEVVATPMAMQMGMASFDKMSQGSIRKSAWQKGKRGGTYRKTKSGKRTYKKK